MDDDFDVDPYYFAREDNDYEWNFEEREKEFDFEPYPLRNKLDLRRKYPK